MNSKAGFTLIDLLVVVAIIGIVLGIGLPSFNSILTSSRLTTYSNEMVRALNLARSEAAKQYFMVVLCKSSNVTKACDSTREWEEGLIVFVDSDNDLVVDAGEEVILTVDALKTGYFYKSSYPNFISYRPDGRSNINGDFRICSPNNDYASFRKIVISDTGRIRTHNDSDKNYDNDTYSSTSVCG